MPSPLRKGAALGLAVTALAALPGCGFSSAKPAEETPDIAAAAESPSVDEPYAVPADIDSAYVNGVLAAIEQVRSDVRRDVLTTHQFSRLTQARLRSIYQEPVLEGQLDVWSDASMIPQTMLKPNPGPAKVTVIELISANSSCIYAKVRFDETANMASGPKVAEPVMVLRPKPAGAGSFNPTPWQESVWSFEAKPEDLKSCAY